MDHPEREVGVGLADAVAHRGGGPALRIASNLKRFPSVADDGTLIKHAYVDLGTGRDRNAPRVLSLFLGTLRHDAIVIHQAQGLLLLLCLLRLLWPFGRARLVVVDFLLTKPGPGFRSRFKNRVMRALFRRIDLFILYQRDTEGFWTYYGIPPEKCRYIPFKVNAFEQIAGMQPTEGEYVYSAGRSYRDFPTLCEAVWDLGFPTVILTPSMNEGAEHGTRFEGRDVPPHVRIVRDDGSSRSWMEHMVNARIMVLTVSPDALFPAGVGTYIQAMAMGKCLIITDSYTTLGILEHEVNAIIVPMKDPAALREAIRRAWEDDDYRRKIAERGRQFALSLGGEESLFTNIALTTIDFVRGRPERGARAITE